MHALVQDFLRALIVRPQAQVSREAASGPFRAVARAVSRLLAGVVAAKVLDFALYVLLARALGVASFGLYTYALCFALLFNVVVDLGLTSVFTREVTRDPRRARTLLADTLRARGVLAILTLAVTIGIQLALGAPESTITLVAVVTTGLIVNATAQLFGGLLRAAGRAGLAGGALVAQSGTALLVGAVLIGAGAGPMAGALAYLAAGVIHLAVSAALARDLWRAPGDVPAPVAEPVPTLAPALAGPRALVRAALPLALSSVFIAIHFRIDAVMLHALQGERAVGLYGGVYRIFEAFAPLCAAYHSVVFPVFVRAADGPRESLAVLCRQSLRIHLLGGIGLAVFFTCQAPALVERLLGPAYLDAAPALAVLIWALPAALMSSTLLQVLNARGRQARGMWAVGATAGANIALNFILIPRHSYLGAAVATVASEVLCFVVLFLTLGSGVGARDLVRMAWRPLLAGGVLAVSLSTFAPIVPAGWAGLGMAGALGAVAYALLLAALGAIGQRDASLLLDLLPAAIRGRWPGAARG